MWIVPKNILPENSKYYHFSTDMEASKEEFQELSQLNQSLMWRSKLSKTSTWWQRWNRVWWIKHLFGRILKPSMENHFITEYTESLEVIRAKEKVSLVKENYGMMNDSFGRILKGQSLRLDLFGASLKTFQDTLRDLSPTFLKAYEIWVTQLRADCLRRKKLAQHIKERDYSFSQWMTPQTVDASGKAREPRLKTGNRNPEKEGSWRADLKDQVNHWTTPVASDQNRSTIYAQGGTALSLQVKQWPTPREFCHRGATTDRGKSNLGEVIHNWPTPQASETEKAAKNTKQGSLPKLAINGQLDQGSNNTNGKPTERLNPEWAAQLMGTTLEQSFFANMAMESFLKQQQKHLKCS